MLKFTTVATTLLLVALAASTTTFASSKGPGESAKLNSYLTSDSHGYDLFEDLDLSSQQKQKIKEMMRSGITAHKEAMREYRTEVNKIITAERFDEAIAKRAIDKMDNVRINEIKMHNQMYNLLTPRQKELYQQEFQKMQQKRDRKLEKRERKLNRE